MKNRTKAAILAFTIGGIGAHDYYLGHTKTGVLKTLLLVLLCWTIVVPVILGFWATIDFVSLVTMSDVEFNSKYNAGNNTQS